MKSNITVKAKFLDGYPILTPEDYDNGDWIEIRVNLSNINYVWPFGKYCVINISDDIDLFTDVLFTEVEKFDVK